MGGRAAHHHSQSLDFRPGGAHLAAYRRGGQEPGAGPAAPPLSSHACPPNTQRGAKAVLPQTCLRRVRGKLHLGRGNLYS